MKICAIDIGTNSIIHLLATIDSIGRITTKDFKVKTTCLGRSLIHNNIISPRAQLLTINTLKDFLEQTQHVKDIQYTIVGTCALRIAHNGSAFIESAQKIIQKKIRVISGQDEIKFIQAAVDHYIGTQIHKKIIIDIGGGSTELIIVSNDKVRRSISIPLGALTLTDQYKNNVYAMEYRLKEVLYKKISGISVNNKVYTLVGVGGTITTLGGLLYNLKKYNEKKIHRKSFTIKQIDVLVKRLSKISIAKRQKIISFDPKRAEIIVAGLLILKSAMNILGIRHGKICTKGLVYGLVLKHKETIAKRPR